MPCSWVVEPTDPQRVLAKSPPTGQRNGDCAATKLSRPLRRSPSYSRGSRYSKEADPERLICE